MVDCFPEMGKIWEETQTKIVYPLTRSNTNLPILILKIEYIVLQFKGCLVNYSRFSRYIYMYTVRKAIQISAI